MIAAVLHLHEGAGTPLYSVDRVRPHPPRRHNIGHDNFSTSRPNFGVELVLIADDAINFRHRGKSIYLCLSRTADDDDTRVRLLAFEAADGLLGLANRLCGHRTGVHDDGIMDSSGGRLAPNDFWFDSIQAAAEGNDIDSHDALALANSAGLRRPLNSSCTGPVIRTWSSVSRQSMANSPPGSITFTLRY